MTRILILLTLIVFAATACSVNIAEIVSQPTNVPASPSTSTPLPTAAQPTAQEPASVPAILAPTLEPPTQVPAAATWRDLPLINARTGETFTFADFSGKTVLVRAMATWCSNCRQGQQNWRDNVLPQVDSSNVVFVSLDIETNNSAATLAQYADGNQFSWVFAVVTPELLAELVGALGGGVTVPPSEPQWIVRPDGSLTTILTDRSASGLISAINGA